jgi:hypothetical protein
VFSFFSIEAALGRSRHRRLPESCRHHLPMFPVPSPLPFYPRRRRIHHVPHEPYLPNPAVAAFNSTAQRHTIWRPSDSNPCGWEGICCSLPDLRVQSMCICRPISCISYSHIFLFTRKCFFSSQVPHLSLQSANPRALLRENLPYMQFGGIISPNIGKLDD